MRNVGSPGGGGEEWWQEGAKRWREADGLMLNQIERKGLTLNYLLAIGLILNYLETMV